MWSTMEFCLNLINFILFEVWARKTIGLGPSFNFFCRGCISSHSTQMWSPFRHSSRVFITFPIVAYGLIFCRFCLEVTHNKMIWPPDPKLRSTHVCFKIWISNLNSIRTSLHRLIRAQSIDWGSLVFALLLHPTCDCLFVCSRERHRYFFYCFIIGWLVCKYLLFYTRKYSCSRTVQYYNNTWDKKSLLRSTN